MQGLLLWIGRLAGLLGVLLVSVAMLGRVSGAFILGGFQIGTVLQGGIAVTLLSCLAYLVCLVEYPRR